MDGESAAIWCPATSDEARQLRRLLVAAGRWHRAGIAGAASVIVWAASSLMLIALAFAVAAGLLPPGQRDAAAVLLLAAGGAALGFAVVVLLPVYIPQAAELVQERLGICDDIIITAAEAAGGRACGSHRFLSAVTRQAVASLGSFQPAVLFLTGPWRIGISAAWLAAFLFALTFAIPDAWRLVGQDRPARVLPAPVLPTSLPSRRVGPGTPELVHFSLRIDPPPYTGREPVVFRAPSSVTAPVGSRVQISAQFSGCESAQLSWSAGPAAAQGRDGIFAELTLIRATSWTISARGPGGHKQLGPFAIRLIPDRPPSARIVSPSGDVRMDSPGPLELSVEAADDYGLTRLALQYRTLRERTWRDIDLQAAGRTVHLRSMLDLRPMELGTGDTLLVRLAATDNNAVSRPATTYSSTLRVSLSPDIKRAASRPVSEIHEMAAREEDAFNRLRQDLQELGSQLDRLRERIAGDSPSAGRRQQAEIADIASRLQRSANSVKQAMDDIERRLKVEDIVDRQVIEKVAELHRLANEVLDRQMRELLGRLQESLKDFDLRKLEADIEKLKELRDRLLRQLDQTLDLLRRARTEMTLEAIARKLKSLADEQQEIRHRTAGLRDNERAAREEADRQAALARETEQFHEQMQQAVERVSEADRSLGDRLAAVERTLFRADPVGEMRQAASALDRLAPSQALGPQDRALGALRQAAAEMRGLQADALAQHRQQLQGQAGRIVGEALALARSQQQLMRKYRDLENQSLLRAVQEKPRLEQAAAEQQAIADGAQRLAEQLRRLAGQTSLASPELAARMEGVAEMMRSAGRAMQGGEAAAARISQEGALSQLHRLAADIVDLSAALGQESAQMALSELLKRLEQLAEQQRSLNDRAQQAGSGNPLLSELALQQSIVRAALEKLMRGAGRELSDRLGGVPQDMDEVAQDLKDLRLTPKTITRQRDILHKMLDAQRSLYTKQQLSHERVAERPKPYKPAPSPPKLVEQAPPRLKLPESGRPFRPPVPEAFRGLASAYENRLQKSR